MSNLPFLDDQEELDRYSGFTLKWISGTIEDNDFCSSLQEYLIDGSVLCRLANKKKAGAIPRFHMKPTVKAMQLENIGDDFSSRPLIIHSARKVYHSLTTLAWILSCTIVPT